MDFLTTTETMMMAYNYENLLKKNGYVQFKEEIFTRNQICTSCLRTSDHRTWENKGCSKLLRLRYFLMAAQSE